MKAIKAIILFVAMMAATPSFAQFTTGGTTSGNNYSDLSISSGYKGFVDFGYGIGVGDFATGRLELSTTHGYQFLPYFYAGLGVGVNYFHEEDGTINIPIYADFRGTLPLQGSKIAPFLDMRIGYAVSDIQGFYFSPSIGIRIATSEKCGLNVGIGYELQKADAYAYYGGYYFEDKVNAGAFTIKLGIDF